MVTQSQNYWNPFAAASHHDWHLQVNCNNLNSFPFLVRSFTPQFLGQNLISMLSLVVHSQVKFHLEIIKIKICV